MWYQALCGNCLIKPYLLSHNELDPLLDYVLLVLISQVLSQFLPLGQLAVSVIIHLRQCTLNIGYQTLRLVRLKETFTENYFKDHYWR